MTRRSTTVQLGFRIGIVCRIQDIAVVVIHINGSRIGRRNGSNGGKRKARRHKLGVVNGDVKNSLRVSDGVINGGIQVDLHP